MSERTYAQRLQDDEDHHLRMCGLLLDARDEDELEDREYEYHDFRFFARPALPPMERAKRGQVCWEENATALAGMPGPTPSCIERN
jgi:hypothetical protein